MKLPIQPVLTATVFIFAAANPLLASVSAKANLAKVINNYRSVVESKNLDDYSAAAKDLRLWSLKNDPYRPTYHFTAPESWINDPNGPIYFNGQYHLFYQYDPMVSDTKGGVRRSARCWGHAVSSDLVHWEDWPVALWPDSEYDCAGVFSGNTFVHDGKLHALYTGNVSAHQKTFGLLAVSHDGGLSFKKEMVMDNAQRPNPASPVHWDAQVWKEGDTWCQLIGGTLPDKSSGTAWLWKSKDLKHWELQKNIAPEIKYNWFWELPYIVPLNDGKCVFMIGAGNPYWVGDYDRKSMTFTPKSPVRQVDAGVYYSFNPNMVDDKGPNGSPRCIMHGWAVIGVPPQQENQFYWEGAHALPRAISVVDDRLWQEPVEELKSLRYDEKRLPDIKVEGGETKEISQIQGDAFELQLTIDKSKVEKGVGLVVRANDKAEGARIWIDWNGNFGINRCSNSHFMENDDQLDLRIFVDRGILEVYCNGVAVIEKCFLSAENMKVFAFCDDAGMTLSNITWWKMKSMWEPAKK